MAIDFPNTPATNDTYTVGNKTWIYDGTAWNTYNTTSFSAETLPGTTLKSTVTGSSLTSVGTLGSLAVTAGVTAATFSGSGASLTSIPNSATTATSANTVSAIVARDASGNFTAGTITASLTGNVSGSAATVTGAAQTAITSVGTLSSLAVAGDVTVDTNTLKVDSTNNRVGIVNASPAYTLDVAGTVQGTQFLQGTDYLSPYQGFRNVLINGAMNVWQRGTSSGTLALGGGDYVGPDRWWYYNNGFTSSITRQPVGSTLPQFLYCTRMQRTSGQTGTAGMIMCSPQETVNSVRLAGRPATLSFYARASSTVSSFTSLVVAVETGTGVDQKGLGGAAYTGLATPISINPTLTSSWQRFTLSGTIASTATEIAIRITFAPIGTAGANDYVEFTGVQLEEGSVATPFEQRPIQQELALCQRYYWRHTGFSSGPYFGGGTSDASSGIYITVQHPVPMRVPPTSIEQNANITDTSVTITPLVASIYLAGTLSTTIKNTYTSYVQYRWYAYLLNSTAFYIACNSEL